MLPDIPLTKWIGFGSPKNVGFGNYTSFFLLSFHIASPLFLHYDNGETMEKDRRKYVEIQRLST